MLVLRICGIFDGRRQAWPKKAVVLAARSFAMEPITTTDKLAPRALIAKINSIAPSVGGSSTSLNLRVGQRGPHVAMRPEGTFYLFCESPGGDPDRFWNALADRAVFVMPGHVMEVPTHFRICLTASEPMIERSLPIFAEVAHLMTFSPQSVA
jgi:hypothetical protein